MINIDEYRDEFEKRCLAAGLTKLNEPIDTGELIYTAFKIKDEKDFDIMFFLPSVQALINEIKKEENGEFYRLDISRNGNVIVLTSSRGDNSAIQAQLVLTAWEEVGS